MKCKYCGKRLEMDDDQEFTALHENGKSVDGWHESCKDNTLGIHIEETVDIQDLFGR